MELIKSPWLALFFLVALAHIATLGFGSDPAILITKCLLAPTLAIWVIQQNGPWILVAALIGCFFGDLFLEFNSDIWFLIGMGAFAIAQISFVTYFVKTGALDRLLNNWWIIPLVVVIAAGLLAAVWAGLDPALRIAVPIYALLLMTTGALAFSTDLRAGIGAALFLFSDALIALRIAEIVPRESVMMGIVVMVTYIAAIFLLTIGITDYDKQKLNANSVSAPPSGSASPSQQT